MSNFLQVGDVIRIEPGMRIYADIADKFVYSNRPEDHPEADRIGRAVVKVGQVLRTVNGTKTFDTNVFAGEYVVEEAKFGGGSNVEDPQGYPDGWDVKLRRMDGSRYDPEGTRVSFYQSGSFTAVIENVPVIRHLERKVEFVEPDEDSAPAFR